MVVNAVPPQQSGGLPNVTNDDLRITLARIEAKLDVTLPAHGERLNEHARILDAHDIRLRAVEQGAAASSAGTTESRRLPNWVPVVAAFAGVAMILVTLYLAARKG